MTHLRRNELNVITDSNQMIIAAIDSLKGRKARPDELKICNFVERRFGLKKEDIIKAINSAVSEGSVLKVKYKDSVSYRNPLKLSHKMQNHIISIDGNSTQQTMKRVLRELRVLSRSTPNGVSAQTICDSLKNTSNYDFDLIEKVLKRAIETGSVIRLPNGNYVLSCGKRIVPRKGDPDQTKQTNNLLSHNTFYLSCNNGNDNHSRDNVILTDETSDKTDDLEVNEESSSVSNETFIASVSVTRKKSTPIVKRARPVSKRKKFKKSLGPDFIESSELGLQYMRDSFEPKCDLCHLTTKSNKREEREELLSCKDCSAKAHPSCMDYSEELAERSGRSPWQCMDCKTCAVCDDSRDGVNMLVCDLCDKGYHMNCLNPPVKLKPTGKWACNECINNKNGLKGDENVENTCLKPEKAFEQNDDLNDDPTLKQTDEKVTHKRHSDTCSLSSTTSNSKENLVNGYPKPIDNAQNLLEWSSLDVADWLKNIGFPEQSLLFKDQEIDGSSLMLLRRSDVLTGFEMKLGPALKIYSHIMRLQKLE